MALVLFAVIVIIIIIFIIVVAAVVVLVLCFTSSLIAFTLVNVINFIVSVQMFVICNQLSIEDKLPDRYLYPNGHPCLITFSQ